MNNIKISFITFLIFISLNINSDEIKLYPSKIVAESFLIEKSNTYGIEKLYDQNTKTSFSFGLIGKGFQKVLFYFDDPVDLTSFEIINGFQEKENFYKKNHRADYVYFYAQDKYGNIKNLNFDLLDTINPQRFNLDLKGNNRTNKIIMIFIMDTSYEGSDYNNLCITEITFFGNDTPDLQINNNPKKLNKYFKSIIYDYMDDYSEFFKREIEYEYSRGGKVNFENEFFELEYLYPDFYPIENNGLKGKYLVNKNKLIFYPEEIFVSRGYEEEYEIDWEPLKEKQELSFTIEQEGCFIKLIPDKEYDILKPALIYIKDWKDSFKNAPEGDYIPIVIQ